MTILKGVPQGSILGPFLFNLVFNDFMYILKHTSAVKYADDNTFGSTGDSLWKALDDAKTDTNSAITWYKNNQMQANATQFHYMHTSKDTDFQCEGINIKSEDMEKMLGINIDKKTEIHLSCYRSNQKMCIPNECFKVKIQNIKY